MKHNTVFGINLIKVFLRMKFHKNVSGMKQKKRNVNCDINPKMTTGTQPYRLNIHSLQHMVNVLKTNWSWFKAIAATVRLIISDSYEPSSIRVYIKLQQQMILIHASSIVEPANVFDIAFKISWQLATCSWYNNYIRREKHVLVLNVVSACSSMKNCWF